MTEQAYFTNGTDVRIRDWDEVDSLTVDDFQYEPQVQSWTHVDVYTIYFGLFDRTKIVVVNRTSFLKTVERPPELASNIDWNQITLLTGEGNNKEARKLLKTLSLLKISNIKSRCEKNKFFVRLSKERAVLGDVAIGNDLQLIFTFRGHAPSVEDVITTVEEFWKV